MDDASFRVTASFLSRDFFRAHPELWTEALQLELAALAESVLRSVARQVQESCASICDGRHRLWLSTESGQSTPAPLRHEARARANEAAFLADAIRG